MLLNDGHNVEHPVRVIPDRPISATAGLRHFFNHCSVSLFPVSSLLPVSSLVVS